MPCVGELQLLLLKPALVQVALRVGACVTSRLRLQDPQLHASNPCACVRARASTRLIKVALRVRAWPCSLMRFKKQRRRQKVSPCLTCLSCCGAPICCRPGPCRSRGPAGTGVRAHAFSMQPAGGAPCAFSEAQPLRDGLCFTFRQATILCISPGWMERFNAWKRFCVAREWVWGLRGGTGGLARGERERGGPRRKPGLQNAALLTCQHPVLHPRDDIAQMESYTDWQLELHSLTRQLPLSTMTNKLPNCTQATCARARGCTHLVECDSSWLQGRDW